MARSADVDAGLAGLEGDGPTHRAPGRGAGEPERGLPLADGLEDENGQDPPAREALAPRRGGEPDRARPAADALEERDLVPELPQAAPFEDVLEIEDPGIEGQDERDVADLFRAGQLDVHPELALTRRLEAGRRQVDRARPRVLGRCGLFRPLLFGGQLSPAGRAARSPGAGDAGEVVRVD